MRNFASLEVRNKQYNASNTHNQVLFDILENERNELQILGEKLGIKTIDNWYGITHKHVFDIGGRVLLSRHNNSLQNALQSIYSSHEWIPWKFKHGVPQGYWQQMKNQRKFFDWLATILEIQTMEDWYGI